MKKALLYSPWICFAFLTSTVANAYWWRFNNFTTKILLLKVKLLASSSPYYAIVMPDNSALFDWSFPNLKAGFCFGNVSWIEAPDQILNDKSLVDKNHTIIDNKAIDTFFSSEKPQYTLQQGIIDYSSSELYRKTVRAAQSIFYFSKDLIGWAAKQYAQSLCRSHNISIIEDIEGTLHFFAE